MKTGTNSRSRLFRRTALALGILLVLMLASPALGSDGLAAPNADDYTISWASVDGGGAAQVNGGSYTLGSSVGQPDAGDHDGGAYTARGGFMAVFAGAPNAITVIDFSVRPGLATLTNPLAVVLFVAGVASVLLAVRRRRQK